MQRVHPFLSPLGFGITFLIFLGLGFSFWRNGGQMFSPGELTAQNRSGMKTGNYSSHAEFESQCQNCHEPLKTTQADLCLRCHVTVFEQVASLTGTHSKLENIESCRDCHPDHLGRDFDITEAAFLSFDHNLTSFNLQWHQIGYDTLPLTCYACHTSQNGFKLMAQACENCHKSNDKDFIKTHLQDFGADCTDCHDGVDRMTGFNHNTIRFPLEGKHVQTACVDCHIDGQFEGVPLECSACHLEPDVHATLFSQDCAACHTAVDWAVMTWLNGEIFDHFGQTGFSLTHHHINYSGDLLSCLDCHASNDALVEGAFIEGDVNVDFKIEYCADCHQAETPIFMDEHLEQFGDSCTTCHDGSGQLTNFEHDTVFVIDGSHMDIACEFCHQNNIFNDLSSECSTCHTEPEIHAGYFGLQCANCHGTVAWAPAKLVSHAFPLDHGETGLIECETCHTTRYTEYTCYGCHEHQPEDILEEHQDEGISQIALAACITCHPDGLEHDD